MCAVLLSDCWNLPLGVKISLLFSATQLKCFHVRLTGFRILLCVGLLLVPLKCLETGSTLWALCLVLPALSGQVLCLWFSRFITLCGDGCYHSGGALFLWRGWLVCTHVKVGLQNYSLGPSVLLMLYLISLWPLILLQTTFTEGGERESCSY